MSKLTAQLSVADNLCQLARDFKSGDPLQASQIRREFKRKSLNDVTRSVVYLMEVIGARDAQFKYLQDENKDLKELLNLKAPGWDKEETDATVKTENGPAEVNASQVATTVGGDSESASAN